MDSQRLNRRAPWADMPCELLELIFNHIDFVSCIRCTNVCKSWLMAIASILMLNPLFLCRENLPAFFFFDSSVEPDDLDYNFFDLLTGKVYSISVPGLKGPNRWVGARDGWLVVSVQNDEQYKLLNPLTGVTVGLPMATQSFFIDPLAFKKVVICRTPDSTNGFLLVGIFSGGGAAYVRQGDPTWIIIDEISKEECQDAIFHEGKIFILTSIGDLHSWDSSFGRHKLEASGRGTPVEQSQKPKFRKSNNFTKFHNIQTTSTHHILRLIIYKIQFAVTNLLVSTMIFEMYKISSKVLHIMIRLATQEPPSQHPSICS
ncbi:F-box family protein [Rhynchospora pubera]|uniref:F-box family protein n=1 Tax=Rhynchospora pubera TaxID=906938 RepID=A0AAV8EK09_9POAL|nr:F-box family protein [Rhynchospora pubera]